MTELTYILISGSVRHVLSLLRSDNLYSERVGQIVIAGASFFTSECHWLVSRCIFQFARRYSGGATWSMPYQTACFNPSLCERRCLREKKRAGAIVSHRQRDLSMAAQNWIMLSSWAVCGEALSQEFLQTTMTCSALW